MRLMAKHGLEGVTMRAVAAEAGLSYGSLFHYFDSKNALLLYAVEYLAGQQTRRVNEYESQYAGLKALEHLLCDDAIVNDTSRDSWMVWMTFQYKVAHEPTFAERHADMINGWLSRIAALLKDAIVRGEIRDALDVELEALGLWAYSSGVGQMGLLHPRSMTAARQKQLIAAYLDKLRRN